MNCSAKPTLPTIEPESNLRLVPRDAILRNGGGASEVGYRGAFSDTFGHEVCEYLRENEDR